MNPKILSLVLAISLTVTIGFFLPLEINRFNDHTSGSITILDEPLLIEALRDVQDRGVLMGLHGWKHENYSAMTPTQAEKTVEKGLRVFDEAGLVPRRWLTPYMRYSLLPPSVREAIEGTGIPISLPGLQTNGSRSRFREYGFYWRNMTDCTDPRFQQEYDRIRQERPATILLHVLEWNPCLKRFISDYLRETNQTNITVRIDDFEVNSPPEKVYDMAELLQYKSVGRVVYGVIPSGTWRGGDPTIFGLSVNTIFRFYWWFYIITALFPLSFFVLWRFTSKGIRRDNQSVTPPLDNPGHKKGKSVSIIVPAYNEEIAIGKCLEGIIRQDFRGEMEIIVVNDGSTDRTVEIASKYPVKLIDLKTNRGKANALNTGIKNAKGDILIFSDSDSHMASNAVTTLVRRLEESEDIHAVAGNVFIDDTDGKTSFLKYFQMIEYRTEQEINRYLQSLTGKVLVCPGPLFAVKREVTEEVQFSDLSVIEDADFTIEILKKSLKVVREPEAKVYTNAPDSLEKWFSQRKRWWYGNLQLWKMHKHWAKRNPWMILNYSSYITSTCSFILLLLLPYLLLTYDNIALILLRSMAYIATPIVLFTLFIGYFFIRERKLMIMLLPYTLLYATMKVVVISYLYIRYLSGRGVRIKFGSRIIEVR